MVSVCLPCDVDSLPLLQGNGIPNPGVEPGSPALQVDSLPAELPGKFQYLLSAYCVLGMMYFTVDSAPKKTD